MVTGNGNEGYCVRVLITPPVSGDASCKLQKYEIAGPDAGRILARRSEIPDHVRSSLKGSAISVWGLFQTFTLIGR